MTQILKDMLQILKEAEEDTVVVKLSVNYKAGRSGNDRWSNATVFLKCTSAADASKMLARAKKYAGDDGREASASSGLMDRLAQAFGADELDNVVVKSATLGSAPATGKSTLEVSAADFKAAFKA